MKVIGYIRVSTNEQAENGVSLAAQEKKVRGYCKVNDWQCVGILKDDGYSAKDLKRPGMQKILAELPSRDRRFDGIVVTKLDRLTRSVRDLVHLTALADKHKVALVSIQEAVDTGTATGQLFRNIVTSISEWERGVIGERTREALAYKRQNGECIGAIPYGFTLGEDGKHLLPIPAELGVLERVRKERQRGLSYDLIADGLNADQVPTKRKGRWHAATVWSVLATARKRSGEPGPHSHDNRVKARLESLKRAAR
jgi:site-specific DNA recombinase